MNVFSSPQRGLKFVSFVLLLITAVPLHAAVAVVRSDETMIRLAPAVVTGTVIETYPRLNDRGDIETVTRILVDETIKGTLPPDSIVDVVQFGGAMNNRIQAQSGAPAYEPGARYLVILDRDRKGDWTTFDLALGQFRFVLHNGNEVVVRDTSDIVGTTESGEEFHDVERPASLFLAFARDAAKRSPRAASDMLHAEPNAALDYDLKNVTTSAVGKWAGGASAMNDSVSASPASGDTKVLGDCESRAIADDPHGDIAGSFGGSGVVATAFFGCGPPCGTCAMGMKNGETYVHIDQMDVVVQDGVSSATLSAGNFNSAMVHEIGHTWGFRHSNQTGNGGGSCALPLPCSSSAIMNSSIVGGLNGTLQSWDLDAANEVYGDGSRQAGFTGSQYVVALGGDPARRPAGTSWRISQAAATCTGASIGTQPSGSTVSSGSPATLTVVAAGTSPFTYQWYVGNPPSTTTPVPSGTTASIQVTPSSTTTYWVQVTNSCGTANSNAATVTVTTTSCASVNVGSPTSTDLGGNSFQLSVSASGGSGFTYTWFQGSVPGSGVQIGTGNPITVNNITQPTSFWAQAQNSCGNTGTSRTVVTVGGTTQCNAINIINQPQGGSVLTGGTVQLSVGYIGTSPVSITWYKGAPPDTSQPVGSGQSITSPPITATSTFYAKLSNCAGSVNSNVVTITATTVCDAPAISTISANPTTATPGTLITLAVTATGSSLTYQWYRGASGDTSNPIANATSATITDTPAATTSYWVKVSSGCGAAAANSNAVTVTISAACVPPSIAQPADQNITYGQKATLTIATTAGSEPLHYSWFQGAKFDTSHPIGTDSPTVTTPSALTQDTQFFVNVSNSCGNVNSETITVKVELPRRRPTRK